MLHWALLKLYMVYYTLLEVSKLSVIQRITRIPYPRGFVAHCISESRCCLAMLVGVVFVVSFNEIQIGQVCETHLIQLGPKVIPPLNPITSSVSCSCIFASFQEANIPQPVCTACVQRERQREVRHHYMIWQCSIREIVTSLRLSSTLWRMRFVVDWSKVAVCSLL